MRRRALAAAGLALLFAAGAAGTTRGAEPPQPELRRLFPRQADLFVEAAGLSRLVLPREVLAECRPDLSDLRVFDALGREAPFLVDAGLPPAGAVELAQSFEARPVEAARSETRRESGPPLRVETFELPLPEAAPAGGSWTLVLHVPGSEFVARVAVQAIGAGGAAQSLVDAGSVFRLGGARPAEKLRLPLPPFQGRRLRVRLESEQSFWLAPAFRLESARTLERGGRIAVPLATVATRSEAGRTLVTLERPRGIVPDLLRLQTDTGSFDRRIEVSDEGPAGGDVVLGSGRLFRVQALVPVGEQELALGAARGERLRVAIDDGDSPPLAGLVFEAVIRQPALIFSVPPGASGTPSGVLRFGGGRAHPPRYDLAGLLPPPQSGATGKRAEAVALLYDPATVHPARLGEGRPNPDFDGAPALAFAMHPGADLDRRLFSHDRPITVGAAPEGLSRLRLEPEDLAVLAEDLSDLRIADASGRQWPYLVEPDAAEAWVGFRVTGPERRDRRSTYRLEPPASPVRFDRLRLETDAAFFDRPFRLEADAAGGEARTLLAGRLARAAGARGALAIDLAPARVGAARLVVEDGDEAPLAFRSIEARVRLPLIDLTAPPGAYTVLMGAPGQAAPRYELERVRDVVLAVRAAPVEAGALRANPDYSLHARLAGGSGRQTALLWAALLAAVAVLSFMTLRLARRESAPGDGHGGGAKL